MTLRFAVTGATGWLGRAAVRVLRRRGATVFPFASTARSGCRALVDLIDVEHDVLLHYAYVTRDFSSDRSWEAYVAENIAISEAVRAAICRHRPAVFYASSGAAASVGPLRQDPYGGLKRIDEHLLRDASAGRCAIARVYNVAGPHVTKPDIFLLTDLVVQALAGGDLVLTSQRPVIRSYVDVEDVAAWAIAMAGEDVCVSTAGDVEVEAGELARLILDVVGRRGEIQRPRYDASLTPDRYVGDALAWADSCRTADVMCRTTREQVQRTVGFLSGATTSARS